MIDEKYVERIRKRNSYKWLKDILIKIKTENIANIKDEKKFLLFIHDIIDMYRGFRSQTNSDYVRESILQLCWDIRHSKIIDY